MAHYLNVYKDTWLNMRWKYNGAGQQNRAEMVIQVLIREAVAMEIVDAIVFVTAIVMGFFLVFIIAIVVTAIVMPVSV